MPEFTIHYAQQCVASRSLRASYPSSRGETTYHAQIVDASREHLDTCTCPGKQFRGTCKHIKDLRSQVCDWHSDHSSEQQNPQQEMEAKCPRCGGDTEVVRVAS